MTMGLGNKIDKPALVKWATKPEYFVQADFKNIAGIVKELQEKMCKGRL